MARHLRAMGQQVEEPEADHRARVAEQVAGLTSFCSRRRSRRRPCARTGRASAAPRRTPRPRSSGGRVDLLAVIRLDDRRPEVLGPRVDRRVGAEPRRQRAPLLARGERDHPPAGALGELHRQGTGAAGRGLDDDRLAGLQAPAAVDGDVGRSGPAGAARPPARRRPRPARRPARPRGPRRARRSRRSRYRSHARCRRGVRPTTSAPGISGSVCSATYSLRVACVSAKLTPARATSTTTSPSAGSGSGSSASRITSGPPNSSIRIALMDAGRPSACDP